MLLVDGLLTTAQASQFAFLHKCLDFFSLFAHNLNLFSYFIASVVPCLILHRFSTVFLHKQGSHCHRIKCKITKKGGDTNLHLFKYC